MDNEKKLATEVAENVEVTTEESTTQTEAINTEVTEPNPDKAEEKKLYTEEDLNKKLDEVLSKKIARNTAKIRKEYERKYGELETVLKVGTGKEDLNDVTKTLKSFYESKGMKIPDTQNYSDRDVEILAKTEAKDIIELGIDEVIDEVDRLSKLGLQNMTKREKVMFKELAEYRQSTEKVKEFSKLGISEDTYNSKEFKEFASKFNPNTPAKDIYDIYSRMTPQKEIQTMGSLKNSTSDNGGVKDFYTRDEALKFTKKDFDRNPALFKAVEKSMQKW